MSHIGGAGAAPIGTVTAAITNDGTFATPAKQDTGNTTLASILADVALLATQATLAQVKSDLDSLVTQTTGIPAKFTTLKSTADLTTSTTRAKTVGTPLANRQGIYIFNNDASINMRWGDSSITTTQGARLAAGTGIWIAAGPSVDVYIIAESGSPVLSITEAA